MGPSARLIAMRSAPVVLVALGLAVVSAGCGTDAVVAGESAHVSYAGPLHVDRVDADHPRAGAAGNVVECGTWGAGGSVGGGVYAEGATADSPAEALEVARSEGGFGGLQTGLKIAKTVDDRVLYVVVVHGAIKQAVIVHNGPATPGAGGDGWYVESWARCDYSELPRTFTDSIGLRIWYDSAGDPVPTKKLEAWVGPAHCDWQSMTFLTLGKNTYVRNPLPELSEYFNHSYETHARIPSSAVDTGYERKHDHLWLAADKSVAYVGTHGDAEVWPRTIKPLLCA